MAPRKPKAGKPRGESAFQEEAAKRRLGRNVNTGNVQDVRKGGRAILKLMRDPERRAEAADLLKRVAEEADPTKPGYEGNEILMPYVEALMQLQADQRKALLKAAGNPEVFVGLPPTQKGELPDLPVPPRRPEATSQAGANDALQEMARQAHALSLSPSTFAGTEFVQANSPDPRAPIDRTLPKAVARLPEGHPRRVEAEEKIIQEIIGLPAMAELRRVREASANRVDRGLPPLEPALPRHVPLKFGSANALERRLSSPEALLRDASEARRRFLDEEIERIGQLEIDPQAEPFGHVVDTRKPIDATDLDAIKQAANQEKADVGIDGPRPVQALLNDLLAGKPINLEDRQGLPAELQVGLYGNKMLSDPIFSDEAPTSVPSAEARDNMIARLMAERDEIDRRRTAFAQSPSAAPIGQRPNITRLTRGTLGLQSPYIPGKSGTIDAQLNKSVRPESARLIEKLYMAAREMGGSGALRDDVSPSDTDILLADALADVQADADSPKRAPQGGGSRRIEINLDQEFPEWRHQMAIPNHQGGYDIPQYSLSGPALARRIAAWHGIDDPDGFERDVAAVLDDAIRRQHNTPPSTERAIKASQTLLVPNMKSSGRGRKGQGAEFFSNPFGAAYADQMFDKRYPMQRPEPTIESQQWNGPLPQELLASELDSSMDGTIDTEAVLNRPVAGMEEDFDSALEAPVGDMNSGFRQATEDDFDFDPLDMPVDDDMGDLSMNKTRRNPLYGLMA